MKKYLAIEDLKKPEDIALRIIQRLNQPNEADEFFVVLEKIDFSRCVKVVTEELISAGTIPELQYGEAPSFIQGDNIVRVHIIKYEPAYALRLDHGGVDYTIPKSYQPESFYIARKVIF
jgi:hypothetical protein